MLSPEQSDIRKSLDSIQSMLSSSNAAAGRSPIQATSLSSRLMIQHHHASSMMEGARRSSQAEEESPASSSTGVRRPSAIRRSPSSAFSTVSNSMMAAAAGGGAENDNSPTRFTNNYMDRHNLGSIGGGGGASDSRMGGGGVRLRSGTIVAPAVLARPGRETTSLLVSPISRHSSSSMTQPTSGSSTSSAAAARGGGSSTIYQIDTAYRVSNDPALGVSSGMAEAPRGGFMGPTYPPSSSIAPSQQQQHQQGGGGGGKKDPTPYHYRSNPSFSPPEDVEDGGKKSGESTSSSRSGLDPPAKSPFSMATPNKAHSSHHRQQSSHQQRQLQFANVNNNEMNELSMIDEDEDFISTTGDQSLVSNVTGTTTLVHTSTPIAYQKYHRAGAQNAHATSLLLLGNGGTPRSPATTTVTSTLTAGRYHPHNNNTTTTAAAVPRGSRLSLIMRDSLTKLASTTGRSLESIWDDVGVSNDERSSQMTNLIENISRLCDVKVREEEALRDQFQKEIADARAEWSSICTALQIVEEDPVARLRRDPSAAAETSTENGGGGGGGVSLQWEYEAMMGRLESLRSVKECAMSDMLASRARIYDAHAALCGCTIEEAAMSSDVRSYTDVESNLTLERREEFRNGAHRYEESVSSRSRAIVSLLLDCQSLIHELELSSSDVNVGRSVDDFKIMNSLQPNDNDENARYNDDQGRSLGRGKSNDYTVASLFESSTCIGIGNSSLDRLTSRIAELNGEKRRRRAKLGEMGQTIQSLWTMLRVTPEEQRAFTTSIRGLGLDTIHKGEDEIARLDELKKVMIGQLVREQRCIIEDLWIKTESSDDERASFDTYFRISNDELLTSEVLTKHEEYASSLKAKLSKMQPILDLISKRETIIEERIELELLQKDPERLKGRGATKQLMKEEKMNRRVTKELPKITFMLEETLRQWYVDNKPRDTADGRQQHQQAMVHDSSDLGHFMYQGSPYLQTMQWQEEEWRTRKERSDEERHRKKQEERDASLSSFGHVTKLPGKKWNPLTDTNAISVTSTSSSARPRSASNLRAAGSGGSHTSGVSSSSSSIHQRSVSNPRFGGRGPPLGDVSSTQNSSTRPTGGQKHGAGGGTDRPKTAAGGRGFRPPSAPRQRL